MFSVPKRTSGTLLKFEASRHRGGYFLKRVGRDGPLSIRPHNTVIDPYDPPSDLYLKFAALRRDGRISDEDLLRFVNAFGLLGGSKITGEPIVSDVSPWPPVRQTREDTAIDGSKVTSTNVQGYLVFGIAEGVPQWHREIEDMNRALRLRHHSRHDHPALVSLSELINRHLGGVPFQTALNSDSPPTISTFVVPESLLAFMWVQLAIDLQANHVFVQCWGCKKWLNFPEGKGPRSDRRACSPTCRSRAYKLHKKEALALGLKGLSNVEIAAKLGRTVEQINKWLPRARHSRSKIHRHR